MCGPWGVLLYLLVTGQYPFEDPRQPQNVVATLQNIAAGKMRPMPKRVTPECVQLIGAMLTQDPAKRITLQGIAQHPWLKIMGFAAMVDTMPEAETAAGAEAQLTTAPAPASQVPETKANEVEQRTTVPSRPQSFSFPEPAQPPIQGKATPVTPSMVALHATAGPASSAHPFGSSHPQAVSPPLSEPTPSRESSIGGKDRVAQVPSGGNGAAQKAEQAKRTKLGSFCKMWFGAGTGKTA